MEEMALEEEVEEEQRVETQSYPSAEVVPRVEEAQDLHARGETTVLPVPWITLK